MHMTMQEALAAAGLTTSPVEPPDRIFCGLTGKRSFPDKDAAKAGAAAIPFDSWSGERMRIYYCDGCDGYHLSHHSR